MNDMKCVISSELSEVAKASEVLHQFVAEEEIDVSLLGQLELILVEAINNVIEHAYQNVAGNDIELEFDKENDEVLMRITDEGNAVPESVQQSNGAMPDENELPEGGWGLGLIFALADRVEFKTRVDSNTLLLAKNL